jgi:Ca2+-binding EF-hand superfamily protein
MTSRPASSPLALRSVALSLAMAALVAMPVQAQPGRGGGRDPAAMLQTADVNHDGVITREEFSEARLARFAKMDRNGDGYVSRDDFGRILRLRPQAGQRIDALLAQGDSNHDGRLSREEQRAAPMTLFDRLDTNRDGRIDAGEMSAAREHAEALRGEFGAAGD